MLQTTTDSARRTMMTSHTPPIEEDRVREALRAVIDPEAGMNIVDLGLVYGIQVGDDGAVTLQLTMTSAACPMADMIVDNVHDALAGALGAGVPVTVELVWEPPWTPERMSDFARAHFGWRM
jgi:metal-sulfur cluster biosynthetic enzyme